MSSTFIVLFIVIKRSPIRIQLIPYFDIKAVFDSTRSFTHSCVVTGSSKSEVVLYTQFQSKKKTEVKISF